MYFNNTSYIASCFLYLIWYLLEIPHQCVSVEGQEAFAKLKTILSSTPVLTAPDFHKLFMLALDTCEVGAGAVLLQAGKHRFERAVAYFSKKLNKHQKDYSTIEKDALALVLAVKHFEVYVASSDSSTKL